MKAHTRLDDVAARVLLLVRVFRAEEHAIGRRVQLRQVIDDLGEMARRALPVGHPLQEHAELVLLKQDRGVPERRSQQARSARDLVAAKVAAQLRSGERAVDDFAARVLARAAVRDPQNVDVRAKAG